MQINMHFEIVLHVCNFHCDLLGGLGTLFHCQITSINIVPRSRGSKAMFQDEQVKLAVA